MKKYNCLNEIIRIRSEYISQKYTFIKGSDLKKILIAIGAKEEDFAKLQLVSNNLVPDPTLPFRESRNGRFKFDFNSNKIKRLEFQPFILSTDEDFVRHDSGKVREFRGIQDDLQLNTAFQALMVFKSLIIYGVDVPLRKNLAYDVNEFICTVFNLRTITSCDILGEPALEGVHSDGVDHTMTTLLHTENITEDSAVTYVHELSEKNAIKFNQADPKLISGFKQHRNFLDTLLIVDHAKKHSLSPVYAKDSKRRATRDMLIFFTRKPVTSEHTTYPYDSLNPHKEIPLTIDIPSLTLDSKLKQNIGENLPMAG